MKLLAALAIVILLASLMGVGSFAPFQSLQNTLANGPSLPTFTDPFQLKDYVALVVTPIGPSNASHMFPDGTTGCDTASYWECINDRDNDTTFVTISNTRAFAVSFRTLEIPDLAPDIVLSRVGIEIRFNSTTITQNMTLGVVTLITESPDGWAGYPIFSVTIPTTPTFTFTTIEQVGHPYQHIHFDTLRDNAVDPVQFYFYSPDWQDVDVSFLEITLYASGDPDCAAPAGAWFPILDELACQVGQGVDWLITALQFVVNAIVFAFLYVGNWLVWFGTVLAAVLSGIISIGLWFTNIDAPAAVQALFGIMTVAVLGFFFLVFARLVRG